MLFKREQETDRDTIVRDYVIANAGKRLTIDDFNDLLGIKSAMYTVRRLMDEGHLIRRKINNAKKGHQYTYEWSDVAKPQMRYGGIPTNRIITDDVLAVIKMYQAQWQNLIIEDSPTDVSGSIKFVKWLESEVKK